MPGAVWSSSGGGGGGGAGGFWGPVFRFLGGSFLAGKRALFSVPGESPHLDVTEARGEGRTALPGRRAWTPGEELEE